MKNTWGPIVFMICLVLAGAAMIMLIDGSGSFSIGATSYEKQATWKGQNITFSATNNYTSEIVRQSTKSSYQGISTSADVDSSGTLKMVASGYGAGSSINQFSSQVCAQITSLDMKEVEEITLVGLVNLDSTFYKTNGPPAGFSLSINNKDLFGAAPTSREDGETQTAKAKYGNIRVKNTENFWYVFDAAGTQLNIVEKNKNDGGKLTFCASGGVIKNVGSTATITLSDLKITHKTIAAPVISNPVYNDDTEESPVQNPVVKLPLWKRILAWFGLKV